MSNNSVLSNEDKDLFRQATIGVKPLNPNSRLAPIKPNFTLPKSLKKIQNNQSTTNTYKINNQDFINLVDPYNYLLSSNCTLSYKASSLSHQTWHDFKRGKRHIDGRIDLHGLTLEQAKNAVLKFIESHVKLNHRVLLLIHGKGSLNSKPILKNAVNHWLPQFPQVLAFITSQQKHGGAGAVYILLKNTRPT